MSERFELETKIFENQLERRSFLKISGLAIGSVATPDSIRSLAGIAGEIHDDLASLENIITKPVVTLEPRSNDTPLVEPKPRGESTAVEVTYTRKDKSAILQLNPNTPLWSEHTNTRLQYDTFASVGTAIITTAEGLANGKQEYCTLFKGSKHVLAAGYEGGLYVYDTNLSQDKDGSSGEWVRLLTQNEQDALPSHAVASAPWEDLEAAMPRKMLIQEVVEGTETLQSLGYKPWAAILPSTKMPDMANQDLLDPGLTVDDCAQSLEEIASGENSKHYFLTERGDIIDLTHLYGKANETFTLFTQLYSQYISGEANPKVSINYSAGSKGAFDFSVDPKSLQPDTLTDTTFSIMNTESVAMEGVAQRYIVERIPAIKKIWASGISAEDLFTNSLGIVGMLSLIHQRGIAPKIEESLRIVHRNNPDASRDKINLIIDEAMGELKHLLAKHVVIQTARTLGVRPLGTATKTALPRGIYPLIPVKITDKDGSNPTRIDLQGAGIRPDNPNVRFRLLHIPTMGPSMERILGKLGL